MIQSYNEWDPLEEIIVGSATHANWPVNDPIFKLESEKTLWKETPVPCGPVPEWIVEEANEDLNDLAEVLRKLGVVVYRPHEMNFVELGGMYNYCPRDRLVVAGSRVVDPVMMYPCRDQEVYALDFVYQNASEVLHMPRNGTMVMDAANVCRMNDQWLYLESPSGNRAAYEWLCRQLPDITIELVNFYSGVHIDSTICPLREGFVVLNASRVTPQNCPEAFKGWTKLWVNDVVAQDFYQYPYASKWIGMNMLSVDPTTVIVDHTQHQLIDDLERAKFTVIPLRLRHARTLGGGFHCVTLDLVRD